MGSIENQSTGMDLTVISPVYMAEQSLPILVQELDAVCRTLTSRFEILLVVDGSPDRSWEIVEELAQNNPHLKGVSLSRNFGQHAAITAGIAESRGDCVVVIDCDLQDDPKYISTMYDLFKKEVDIVYTQKSRRAHSLFKNLAASFFSRFYNLLVGNPRLEMNPQMGSFSMMSRKVARAYLSVGDYHRHHLLVLRWMGFSQATIKVEHRTRSHGESSYSFIRLVRHGIAALVSQTDRLLFLSVGVGFAFFLLSIIASIYLALSYILRGHQPGWTSLIIVGLLSTGLILISLGILGIYLGKMFEQVKGRPLFLVDRRTS